MTADEAHLRVLKVTPELGPYFGMDDVLLGLAEWAWVNREDADLVRRYLAYVDWLVEHGPDEVADSALESMEQYPFRTLRLGG